VTTPIDLFSGNSLQQFEGATDRALMATTRNFDPNTAENHEDVRATMFFSIDDTLTT